MRQFSAGRSSTASAIALRVVFIFGGISDKVYVTESLPKEVRHHAVRHIVSTDASLLNQLTGNVKLSSAPIALLQL